MSEADGFDWVEALSPENPSQQQGINRLHDLLVRASYREFGRRIPTGVVNGQDREHLAHEAAADAMVAILRKLPEFRGESRFTTWAYKFVILEVSHRLGRLYQRRDRESLVALTEEDWNRFEDRFGISPSDSLEANDLATALRSAITGLTDRQRTVFEAIVVRGIPLDAVVEQLGTNRNAIYKTVFDARRKIRAALVADGYIEPERSTA